MPRKSNNSRQVTSRKTGLREAGLKAVECELRRQGMNAELTREGRKTFFLLKGEKGTACVEVKTKQKKKWPAVKGIAPDEENKFLVLVDFEGISLDGTPTFYVISRDEWRPLLEGWIERRNQKARNKEIDMCVEIDERNVAIWRRQLLTGQEGKVFQGVDLDAEEVAQFENDWAKILSVVGPAKS